MFERFKKSKIKEEAMGKRDREKSFEEDLESFPFGGIPFSYEGRFSALFGEDGEKNSNMNGNGRNRWNEVDEISDDSFRGLFPLPLIARYKFVPFVALLVVALLGSFALVKNIFNAQPSAMTIHHALVRNGFGEIPPESVQEKKLVSFEY